MGIAASLFFSSNDSEKQTLHRRVTPSAEQFDEQQIRWNILADHLVTDLKKRSGCSIRSWLQGSYKFGTQVRPPSKWEEFDIDLGIYFEWDGQPEDGEHEPDDLRAMVQASLATYAKTGEGVREVVVPAKAKCSRIHYEGNFHMDVPTYHLDDARDARRLATNKGWEVSDPKALFVWWYDALDEQRRPKARRHVRYVKCWAALKFGLNDGRPSSVMLTVLVAQAIVDLKDDELASDDEALANILNVIIDRLERSQQVLNPANDKEDLNRLNRDQRNAFLDGLKGFRDTAEEASAAETELEAANIWSRAFAHFFPLPDTQAVMDSVSKSALVPVATPDINVVARPKANHYHVYKGTNRIGPIPKGCEIIFEIVNPSKLPPRATIEWMVRNEGAEAEDENDLGHISGTGLRQVESSAYRGTHYMDCVVKQFGQIVGFRRVPVEISGVAMPPRNPARRPTWTALRGQR